MKVPLRESSIGQGAGGYSWASSGWPSRNSPVSSGDGGVVLLTGHRGEDAQEDLPFQDASALYENDGPCAKERFGYTDGIGHPVFEGQITDGYRVAGRGKLTREGGWAVTSIWDFTH
jgi:hypothetical protein